MEITDGSMSYEMTLDYDQVLKGAKQILAALGDIDSAMSAFGSIDDWSEVTEESLRSQRDAIKQLEKEYQALGETIRQMPEGEERDRKRAAYEARGEELEREKQNLADMEAVSKAVSLSQADLRKQLTEVRKEMTVLANAGLKDTEAYQKLKDKAKEMGREMKTLNREYNQAFDPMRSFHVAQSLRQVAQSLRQIGQAAGNEDLANAADFMSTIASGIEGFVQGGWVGVITAAVSAAVKSIAELIAQAEKLNDAMDASKVKAFSFEISQMLKQDIQDSIFGKDAVKGIEDTMEALEKVRERKWDLDTSYNDKGFFGEVTWNSVLGDIGKALSLLNSIGKAIQGADDEWTVFSEGVASGMTEIEALAVRSTKDNWFGQMFLGLEPEFKNLKTLVADFGYTFKENFGDLSQKELEENIAGLKAVKDGVAALREEDKLLIDELIAQSEAYKDAMAKVYEYLNGIFGQVTGTVADQLVETFVAGGDAVMDFDAVLSDVSKTLAKQAVQHMLINSVMKEYEGEMQRILLYETDQQRRAEKLAKVLRDMKQDFSDMVPVVKEFLDSFKEDGLFNDDSGMDGRIEAAARARDKAQNMRLQTMVEGYEKEIEQIKVSRRQERKALQRELDADRGMMSEEEKKAVREQISLSRRLEEKELSDVGKKWAANAIKAKQSLADAERKEDQKELERRHEMQQNVIDLMDEGATKELAQMELNHQRRIEAIRRQAEEDSKAMAEANRQRWLDEQTVAGRKADATDYYQSEYYKSLSNGLTAEQTETIQERTRQAIGAQNKLYAKQNAEYFKQMLSDYGDYAQRRADMKGKYMQEMDLVLSRFAEAASRVDGEAMARYGTLMKRMSMQNDQNLADLKIQELEWERMEAAVSGDVGRVRELNEEIRKMRKQMSDIENAEQSKSLSTIFKEWKDDLKASEVFDSLSGLGSVMESIGEAVGNTDLSGFGNQLSVVGDVAARIASGDFLGAALAVISAIGNAIAEDMEKMKEFDMATRQASVNADMLRMSTSMEKGGGIFGDDAVAQINGYVEALHVAAEGTREYAKAAVDAQKQGAVLPWESEGGEPYMGAGKGFKVLDRNSLAEFFGGKDKYVNLTEFAQRNALELYDTYGNLSADVLETFRDTYTQLSEEDSQWLDNAIAYSEKYAEAMEGLASYLEGLFGNTVDTIVDQIFDGAVDIKAITGDVGEQMAKDLMKSTLMTEYFGTLKDDMSAVLRENGGMTDEAAAAIFALYTEAMARFENDLPRWQEVAEKYSDAFGFDMEAASTGQGTALTRASQESIDLMNGQLNAARTTVANIYAMQQNMDRQMAGILAELSGFRMEQKQGMESSNEKLDRIIDNTSSLGTSLRGLG